MNCSTDKHDALRLLNGLENGNLSAADASALAQELDPVLVYVIVSFLRAVYPASDPAASAVLERVVQLTSGKPALIKKHEDGQQDSVSHWFEDEYAYGDFRGRGVELVELIVDKLES